MKTRNLICKTLILLVFALTMVGLLSSCVTTREEVAIDRKAGGTIKLTVEMERESWDGRLSARQQKQLEEEGYKITQFVKNDEDYVRVTRSKTYSTDADLMRALKTVEFDAAEGYVPAFETIKISRNPFLGKATVQGKIDFDDLYTSSMDSMVVCFEMPGKIKKGKETAGVVLVDNNTIELDLLEMEDDENDSFSITSVRFAPIHILFIVIGISVPLAGFFLLRVYVKKFRKKRKQTVAPAGSFATASGRNATDAVAGTVAPPASSAAAPGENATSTAAETVAPPASFAAAPGGNATSTVAVLKEYKELLDNGLITEEDYEVKKKQLLGL